MVYNRILYVCLLASLTMWGCKPDEPVIPPIVIPTPLPEVLPTSLEDYTDTYASLAPFSQYRKWGPFNVHDPSVIWDRDTFYSFSTDVMYGSSILRAGIQVRSSADGVAWKFEGWALPSLPQEGSAYIRSQGSTPFENVWAPYIMKVGSEYRLYYSQSSAVSKLSVIGLLTASHPLGPWKESGLVVTSNSGIAMTNAIDPTVTVTPGGKHYMYYGSAYDGIYIMELNPATGLALTSGDKGSRVAQRGFTNGKINGNIEGPEIIYHPGFDYYYLFIAYDWLESKYNVRVGRSKSPTGPFLDYNGNDLNLAADNGPMILAPYAFEGHAGWQGVAHNAVVEANGDYYLAHQGRPVVDRFMMVLHFRKIFWTEDQWPVVSPERYAATVQSPVAAEEIAGNWEQIVLGYRVVPGFANEQTLPDLQFATPLSLDAAGTINGDPANHWTYDQGALTLSWNNDEWIDKTRVERGYDWENRRECLVFSGLNQVGTAVWGKKQ